MLRSKVDEVAGRIKGNVFLEADSSVIDGILAHFKDGEISEAEALLKLREIEKGISGHLIPLDAEKIQEEWIDISILLEKAEQRYLKKANQQFYIGTLLLPFGVLVIVMSFLFGWPSNGSAPVIAGLLGAGLAALAAHSFLVLRVHQQASTAAERLAEKRFALLFLKLALGSTGEERKGLLDAGTSMFLGHQAPKTVPLSSDDLKMLRDASR